MTGTDPGARPISATRACYLALALTVASGALSLVVGITQTDYRRILGDSTGHIPLVLGILFTAVTTILGVLAVNLTLKGSNAWRVTLMVFGWLSVAQGIALIVSGATTHKRFITVNDQGEFVGTAVGGHHWYIAWGAIWALGAAVCSIVLVRKDIVAWTQPGPAMIPAPAGWYPGMGGQQRYWTGERWADEIPAPDESS